jgi:RecA-family ATPase
MEGAASIPRHGLDGEDDARQEPPSNIEVEQGLLGALLIDNRVFDQVSDICRPEYFADGVHGRIYTAIATLIDRGEAANPITLKTLFDQDGALAEIGGAQYLARLAGSAVTTINVPYYAEILIDLHLRREIQKITVETFDHAGIIDLEVSAADIIHRAGERLVALGASSPQRKPSILADADVARWDGIEPRQLIFTVDGLAPQGMTSLASGEGGGGKSLLLQMACTCVASAFPFLGKETVAGAAFGLFAEDPDEVLHLRQARINQYLDRDMGNLAGRLFIRSFAGADAALWAGEKPTEFFARLERELARVADLKLLTLDNAALLFRGDESNRNEVTAFINALNGLAGRLKIGLVLSAHASKSYTPNQPLNVTSGSTAWVNACRSVIDLQRGAEGEPAKLKLVKANHTKPGAEILLKWQDGLLVPVQSVGGVLGSIQRHAAERVFLDLLAKMSAEGRPVSDNSRASNYAPKKFAARPDREGYIVADFAKAMEGLFAIRKIEMTDYGRPGDKRRKIVLREVPIDE